jgi:hypothetical protein
VRALRPLGLSIRAGVHTGEVDVDGDRVSGIAVHIAARVAAESAPGEVLVSQTVNDLVAGSGLEFTDRGSRALAGVPGEWRLLAVVDPDRASGDAPVPSDQLRRLVSPAPSDLGMEARASGAFIGRVRELERLEQAAGNRVGQRGDGARLR